MVIMGRKRKIAESSLKAVSETKAHFLPPCRICNAAGAGFHYGVNTCEACKGFFHRSLRFHSQYKCDKDKNCPIQFGKGRLCQWCRYQKCLAMGMSKEAIKTGRYSSSKKTGYILEVKKMREEKQFFLSSQESNALSPNHSHIPQFGNDCCQNHENTRQNLGNDISDSFMTTTPSPAILPVYSPHIVKQENMLSSPLSSPVSESALSSSPSPYTLTVLRSQEFSPTSNCHSPWETVSPATPMAPGLFETSTNSSYSPPISYGSVLLESRLHTSSFNSSSIGSLSEEETDLRSTTFSAPAMTSQDRETMMEQFSNSSAVLKRMVEAHELIFTDPHLQLSWEERMEESRQHYDSCKLRNEMFGKLARLPDEEYDRIFMETGLDADGRQQQFSKFGAGLEKMVQRMVQFAKSIPGFCELNMQEKINLIKFSRMEFTLICNYILMNPEVGVIHANYCNWICALDMKSAQQYDLFVDYVNLCRKFLNLDLCQEEYILLKAMAIMAPDHSELTNTPAILEIHWNITEMFINCIAGKRENHLQFFARVIGLMTEFRSVQEKLKCFLRDQNMQKYSRIQEKPLLKEVLTDIFL